jgi:hypothetical protein
MVKYKDMRTKIDFGTDSKTNISAIAKTKNGVTDLIRNVALCILLLISVNSCTQDRLYIKDRNIYFDGRQITNENSDTEAIYMEKYNTVIFSRRKAEYQDIWKYNLLTKTEELIIKGEKTFVGDLKYTPDEDENVFYYHIYDDSIPDTYIYNMKTNSSSHIVVKHYVKDKLRIKNQNIYFDGRQITDEYSDTEAIYVDKYNAIIYRRISGEYQSIWRYDLLAKTKELIVEEHDTYVGGIEYAPNVNSDVFYYGAGYGATYIVTCKYDINTKSSSHFIHATMFKIIDKGKYKGCFVIGRRSLLVPCLFAKIYYYLMIDEKLETVGCIYVEKYDKEEDIVENEKFVKSIDLLDYDHITFVEEPHCDFTYLDSAYILAEIGLQYISEFKQTNRSMSLKNKIEKLRLQCEEYMYHHYDDIISFFPQKLQGQAKTVYDFIKQSNPTEIEKIEKKAVKVTISKKVFNGNHKTIILKSGVEANPFKNGFK